jgi:opacity protein-like surface antigen
MVYRRTLLFLSLLTITCTAYGQALPTATRVLSFQIGGAVSLGSPDYGAKNIAGISIYGDLDYGSHWGLDGEIHDLNLSTPEDIGETTYLLSVRYKLNYGKIHPHVRVGAGWGSFNYDKGDYPADSSTRNAVYALGAGLDYYATRRIHVRAIDFEYQDWRNYRPNGLTPYVISIGAAYSL